MRTTLLAAGSLALMAVAVAAAPAGQGNPTDTWTQEEALGVLTNSPWAKQETIYQMTGRLLGVLPGGKKVIYRDAPNSAPRQYSIEPRTIEPERLHAVYGVRWSSAEIVQQALERLGELNPVLAEMQAKPSELSPDHFVLTAHVVEPPSEGLDRLDRPLLVDESGNPVREPEATAPDLFAVLSEEEMKERAELRIRKRERLAPERVVRHGLGASAGVSFFFPRQQQGRPTLAPEDGEAEFVFKGPHGSELKVKFRLAEMRRAGQSDY